MQSRDGGGRKILFVIREKRKRNVKKLFSTLENPLRAFSSPPYFACSWKEWFLCEMSGTSLSSSARNKNEKRMRHNKDNKKKDLHHNQESSIGRERWWRMQPKKTTLRTQNIERGLWHWHKHNHMKVGSVLFVGFDIGAKNSRRSYMVMRESEIWKGSWRWCTHTHM